MLLSGVVVWYIVEVPGFICVTMCLRLFVGSVFIVCFLNNTKKESGNIISP